MLLNKNKRLLVLIGLLCIATTLLSVPHVSSYPYIAPDTFRQFCTFVLDNDSSFDPHRVQKGDLIYVQADFFKLFFTTYHPHIKHPYILINQEGDLPAPGVYKNYLDDDKLHAWFARNADCAHPKLHPIPIGIANQIYAHGNIEMLTRTIKAFKNKSNKNLLYLNFSMTHPERRHVYNLFSKKSFCTVRASTHNGEWHACITPQDHLIDLARHKFVLSPQGNGLDCHRTWEALLMGCIPIVRTSTLDPLYTDLPVVIVNNWTEVTQEFLNKTYERLQRKTYKLEKLYAPYWLDLIRKHQTQLKNS